MNRSWFLSFYLSVMLTLIAVIMDPDITSLFWWSFYTSYLVVFLFLFFSLFLAVRQVCSLIAYLYELPPKVRKRYRFRFAFWISMYVSWFLLIAYFYPIFTILVTFFLMLREGIIWRRKQKKALQFLVRNNVKKQRKSDAKW